ncbi:CWF19-like protein 2 [Arapaima gigas]
MAAYTASYENVERIKEKRELKQKAREEILRQAKEKYEQEERRRELKRARGEDTWMLPQVDQRLQELEQEHSGTSKKKKSSKKSKKKKKKVKKDKKASHQEVNSDSSEDSEDEWVEAHHKAEDPEKAWKLSSEKRSIAINSDPPSQRDEWMTFDFLTMKTSSVLEQRAEREKAKEVEREKAKMIEQAGLHKLELNPYWKDGGSGLPSEDAPVVKAAVVDDGGLSWLRKSYQRMKEQALREQRSLEDVVSERYGSMEKFHKRLKEAESAVEAQGGRGGERDSWRGSLQRSHREQILSTAITQDREQGTSGNRNKGKNRDRNRERTGDRGRGEERCEGRDRDSGGKPEDTGQRTREQLEPDRESRWSVLPRDSLKTKFLKPSNAGDDVSTSWGIKCQAPVGFTKPCDSMDDCVAGHLAWRKEISAGQESTGSISSEDRISDDHRAPRPKEVTMESVTDQQQPQGKCPDSGATWLSPREPKSGSDDNEGKELLTDEEMNKLGAKLVKAEFMGNKDLVEKLRAQLEAARQARENQAKGGALAHRHGNTQSQAPGCIEEDQEVLLYRMDRSGQAWPVSASSQPLEPRGGRRKKQLIETHRDGERMRYFADDDSVDLREMVRREKMNSSSEQNALYSRMVAKAVRKQDRDNYTLDDMFVSSAAQQERLGQEEERQRRRAIQEHQRLAARMDKCPYCFDSAKLPKHLVVAIGAKVYLCLPNAVSLTEGHCLIVPLQHHTAATTLDEEVWAEVQLFRRALVKMFEDHKLDCVFLETHMNPKQQHHMVYECIPLPKELGDMAPIYFKKAIMECDEEWAMNKKLVDLSSKDIRRAVPKGLPYFSVDFGLQGGFAHVIENEHKFPPYFGKEVLGGMLDLEPRCWRKPARENFEDQRKKVLQFAQRWKPFDCTKTNA